MGGTLNVLDALTDRADRRGPRLLVLASTAGVYGTPERQPISEDAPTLPENPYGASKLAADQAATGVTDTDLSRLIPKIFAVHAGLEPELVINGDGSAVRDFVHVLDMAEAFARALEACTARS